MLTIERDNDKVVVKIESGLANNCVGTEKTTIPFSWQCSYPYAADVLARHIRQVVSSAIEKARREAYEQGWKDAKSKKPKTDWFQGWL